MSNAGNSGLFNANTNIVDTKSSSTLPAWMSGAGQDNFNKALGIANTPYKAPDFDRVAGLAPEETSAINTVKSSVGNYQPGFDAAASNYGAAANPIYQKGADGKSSIDNFMSPYTDSVIDPTLQAYDIDASKRMIARNNDAAHPGSGAFGRYRSVIGDEAQSRADSLNKATLAGNLRQSAYDRAVSAAQGQQNTLLNVGKAQEDLGAATHAEAGQDASRLETMGDLEREIEQQKLNTKASDFYEGRDWDKQMLSLLTSTLANTPHDVTGTNQVPVAAPSVLAQLAGLATAGVGAAKLLK